MTSTPPQPAATRPPSAIAPWLAFTGLLALLAGLYFAVRSNWPDVWVALAVMAAAAAPAIVFDGLPKAVARGRGGGLAWSLRRICLKALGVCAGVAFIAAAVALVPFFQRAELSPLLDASWVGLGGLALCALAYIAITDAICAQPEDGLYFVGAVLTGGPSDTAKIKTFVLSCVVKIFFFTLMLSYLTGDVSGLRSQGVTHDLDGCNRLIFTCDAALAGLGYVAALKLFDWEIRDVEQTLVGWVCCCVCYEPFYPAIERAFLTRKDFDAAAVFAHAPLGFGLWTFVVGLSNVAFVLSTVAFGPLFSNLTRRGIITAGLYRFTKHPAYIAKNVSFCVGALPAILSDTLIGAVAQILTLAYIVATYVLRARCEEKMLAADPVYLQYRRYVDERGALAFLRRKLRLRPVRAESGAA